MQDYQYLIIGGGIAANAALGGIRQENNSVKIGILSSENHLPYNRPPLSKKLWLGEPFETVWCNTPLENVEIHLGKKVVSINPKEKIVIDDTGKSYHYGKLLIATGGKTRKLPFNADGIIYFRTLDDYYSLRELTEKSNDFLVIGGGFIGSEIAAALAINDKSVTMIFPEDTIGSNVYPKSLSRFITEYYETKGIKILAKDGVENIEKRNSKYYVKTKSGHELIVDGVVAGIGIEPDTELAKSAGLKIDNGIVVNEFLQTSNPDIYAAGDVANYYNPALEKRRRVEHEDNSLVMGELAGINMAGGNKPYHHLPYFYSDLFDLAYEAVGELNSGYEIFEDWKEEFREGVVYYLNERRVRGVLLWNTWDQVDNARKLIAAKDIISAHDLKNRLPE